MKIVETFRSAIGSPDALREVRDGNRLVAAVGRWRHGGTQVKYWADGVAVLVFNVSGGQLVKRRTHEGSTVQAMDAAITRGKYTMSSTATLAERGGCSVKSSGSIRCDQDQDHT